jgi:hypothetical protein
LNRSLNLLPWLVATVAPLLRLRPLPGRERRLLASQFSRPDQRDRIIDVFSAMGRDEAFMRATAQAATERCCS